MRRDGTPAWTVKVWAIRVCREDGRGVVNGAGRMSRRSQCMFLAKSEVVEREVGRMIHLMTLETTRGLMLEDLRLLRNVEMVVGGVRDRR